MSKEKITLSCQECKSKNYVKNKSVSALRLTINKFCKKCNKKTLHKEEK
ncbi:50S ribosomal protein L33 [Mesomycoplasma lagogenitalium]|uniref:Large ribosomal subunit protein bL33 n=1 Tax=Mesomycoplasma lagogenitalium TaxID=171286 RepID=A0ABY8LWS2_9BACT|nr:50S ribosomal protein L33 [Mesomycoplasma lagogenitalium]WGI36871.1 50S ribosomal protein L33 [Mesomycoplasma lagogenitalium]